MTGLRLKFCGEGETQPGQSWYLQEEVEIAAGDAAKWSDNSWTQPWRMCPAGQYIVQGEVQAESWIGPGRTPGNDDTAINGVQFKCKSPDSSSETILEAYGKYGEWRGWTKFKPGKFVSAVRARVDGCTGVCDEAGLTGLHFWTCQYGEGGAYVHPPGYYEDDSLSGSGY